MIQIIETDRLILRSTIIEDAEFVLELLNTPKWIEYIGDRNVRSLDDAKQYIVHKILPQYKKLGYGNFTVIRKLDNKKIGSCGLFDREGLKGVDMGFGFLPECEHNGYGYESANKVKQLAKENYNLKQINAITSQHNTSSQKLLKKLGLTYLRLITLPDSNEELMLYQLTF
ncbi:MAG: GNAT family N-acetyltransferase [Marinicellaceae bacterium]